MREPPAVLVGGGFAGPWTVRALARDPVRITRVARRDHHLVQPLLHQVATAGLCAPDSAAPLRHILRGQRPRGPHGIARAAVGVQAARVGLRGDVCARRRMRS